MYPARQTSYCLLQKIERIYKQLIEVKFYKDKWYFRKLLLCVAKLLLQQHRICKCITEDENVNNIHNPTHTNIAYVRARVHKHTAFGIRDKPICLLYRCVSVRCNLTERIKQKVTEFFVCESSPSLLSIAFRILDARSFDTRISATPYEAWVP